MMQCFACMKDFGVALVGRLPGDAEAPRKMCRPGWFCDECKGFMAQGVIMLSVRDGESGNNPYRTGRFAVVLAEAVERWPACPVRDAALRMRMMFVEDSSWKPMGLPMTDVDNRAKL
jgi:hypothetical protein